MTAEPILLITSGQERYRQSELREPGAVRVSVQHVFSIELHTDCRTYEQIEHDLAKLKGVSGWIGAVPANPAYTVTVDMTDWPDESKLIAKLNRIFYKRKLVRWMNGLTAAPPEEIERLRVAGLRD